MRHHLYLWACHKHISAHIGNGLPNGHICFNLLMWGCYSFQNIFLQHGITQNRPPFLLKENNRLDLFVCACQRETDFVRKELGYSEREARCLGFCRYDNLSVRPADASPAEPSGSLKGAPEDGTAADSQYNPRQILIMPTWRSWLFTDQKKEFAQNQADFLQSEYCRQYRALLDHPRPVSYTHLDVYKRQLLERAENADETYVREILPQKMVYNLEYIRQYSFWGDFRVLFETVKAVFGT